MRVPCRQHRPVDVLPRFVLCPEDAIDVLFAVAAGHPDARHIALVLDPDRRGRLVIPFPPQMVDDGGGVDQVADLLLEAVGDDPWHVTGLVLGSWRDGTVFDESSGDDRARWVRLQERCRDYGPVELLDWFLLFDDGARSMSETDGPGWPDDGGV